MLGYRQRLEADLTRWQQAGWVDPRHRDAILADAAAHSRGVSAAPILAMLGAVLLCFGIMLFVGANWQEMPRLARLGVLFAGIWASLGIAGLLRARGAPVFAEAAIVLAIGIFGAAIMLIGQLYNLSANPSAGLLLWLLGATAAAWLLRSNAGYVVAILVAGVWTVVEMADTGHPHWWFVLAWLVLFALIWTTTRTRFVLHLLGIVGAIWLVALGYVLNTPRSHEIVVIIGLALLAFGLLGGVRIDHVFGTEPGRLSKPIAAYGLAVAFAALFALQFITWSGLPEHAWLAKDGMPLAVLAAVTLALVLGTLWYGLQHSHVALTWLSYIGFSGEIVALYFKTVGSLLDTSLFFLSAGVLSCLLAWAAFRLHQHRLTVAGGP